MLKIGLCLIGRRCDRYIWKIGTCEILNFLFLNELRLLPKDGELAFNFRHPMGRKRFYRLRFGRFSIL